MKRRTIGYKKHITTDEVERLLQAITNPKVRTILQVVKYTGLRIGDCCTLKTINIKGDTEALLINEQKKGKHLLQPINQELKRILQEHTKKYQPKTYLFAAKHSDQPIKTSTVRWQIYHARKQAQLEETYADKTDGKPLHRISAHTLRHYFATKVYEASGHDARATQNLLNHSDIKTTFKFYIDEITLQRKQEIVNML